jgi:hypothetical protein
MVRLALSGPLRLAVLVEKLFLRLLMMFTLMVRLGLWGISTRATACKFVWISFVSALVCLFHLIFFPGVILFFSVYWYIHSIRWVDQYGKWGGRVKVQKLG